MGTGTFSPRAVVFDLDGTLIDSLSVVLQAIRHALEPYGARPTAEIFARLGGPPERFLATLVADERHVPPAVQRMEAFHRANGHLIRPFEGAERLLQELHTDGVTLAIWTGRDRDSTQHLLRQQGWERYFRAVVCGDDLPTHKPDAAGLCEIIDRIGIRAADTLFVGDADVDVLGGAGAGVKTLLIRHTRAVAAEILAQAWATAGSPAEAFRVVEKMVHGGGQ